MRGGRVRDLVALFAAVVSTAVLPVVLIADDNSYGGSGSTCSTACRSTSLPPGRSTQRTDALIDQVAQVPGSGLVYPGGMRPAD